MKLRPFEVVSAITRIETIAQGKAVRSRRLLRARFGPGNWKKKKGVAWVRLLDGTIKLAELHWYQAHGIGKRFLKIKRYSLA